MIDIHIAKFETYIYELEMPIIVIYENPSDYPKKYVARLWIVGKPTPLIMVKDSFEELVIHIPATMVNIGRNEEDDKAIICSFV